jgi:hypothetical protein
MAKAKKTAEQPETLRPRNDAYTGMLLLSLLVLVGSCVLIYLDYSRYPTAKPPPVPKESVVGNPLEGGAPAPGAAPAPGPAPAPAPAPGPGPGGAPAPAPAPAAPPAAK